MDATRICCASENGTRLTTKLLGFPDVGAGVRACYGLLTLTALKKLWDGVSGYLG
ncbi:MULTISPECIES: hypothetical protein [unclassified Afipia]|uniref:hypothetical protein n=1 Tax=unclassified Afipia TaxID=2642050 RepID=UPI000410AC7D|nr:MULTISPECIES: hypothetical protein [unclassified Afipia]